MKISEVEIKKFKSIDKLCFNLKELIAVVGKNNYGKTAIFEALLVFFKKRKLSEKDIHMYNSEKLPIISVTFIDIEEIDLMLLTGLGYDHLENWKKENNYQGELDIILTFKGTGEKIKAHYNLKDHKSTAVSSKNMEDILPAIKYVSSIRNPDDNTANKNSSNLRQLMDLLVKEEEDEHEILEFGKEKVKISQIKRMLNEKENSRLKSLSEEITNNFQNLLGNKSLSLNIEVEKVNITYSHETKITDHDIKPHMNELASFDILSSGTGMQSLMILSILEAYIEHNELEKDFILIIEEPEVYLHPSLQRKMINVLKQLSQTNQILISTHSPIVVGQVNLNELVCIKKEYGKTIIMNNDPSFVIQELGIQPDDIFQHTKILFVEGPHDKILIESLIEKLEKSGEIDNTLKEQLQIVDVGGIKQMSFYANTRVLQVMNHTHHDYYNFWMMVDSDGNSAETVKRDILQSVAGISSSIYKEENIFVLSEYALESYFIDELILNSLFKDLDSDKIELICSKYFALYAEQKEKKRLGLINKEHFKMKFKPKHFFYDKNEKFYTHTWKLQQDEITILKDIQSRWSGQNIDKYIESLPLDTLRDSKMNEIIELLLGIFEHIGMEKIEK
ncbi:hypothetical protein COJ23_26575 [Priestia megaterium]|uniref:ATP-dependent nuclease n=1 Tax=Priestia megaterium TaxID=1404 RepID=UPI000BF9C42D|nr:AAA family ATPase [Priestia megaterium]PFK42073.1 hypothetical protein COJ23_26575 [Priestia megaterium]